MDVQPSSLRLLTPTTEGLSDPSPSEDELDRNDAARSLTCDIAELKTETSPRIESIPYQRPAIKESVLRHVNY